MEARPDLAGENTSNLLRLRPEYMDRYLRESPEDERVFFSELRSDPAFLRANKKWKDAHTLKIQEQRISVIEILRERGIEANPWAEATHRKHLKGFEFFPGFYPLRATSSYKFSPPGRPYIEGEVGYSYKAFLTFHEPHTALSPQDFYDFAVRLHDAGFKGDMKFLMLPGYAHIYWNNLILYGKTTEQAKIAERVGLEFFSGKLESYSRGVDGKAKFTDYQIKAWPRLVALLPSEESLPVEVRAYLDEPKSLQ
jgi:hypothetical protein